MAYIFRVAAALVALSLPAAAADWVEPPFDPPVGSRWIITSDQNDVEDRGTDKRTTSVRTKVELTIDEKIATGYRVTYVTRELAFDGNAPGIAIAGQAFSVMRDVVIRAKLDAAGKPKEVENLAEVRATMGKALEGVIGAFDKNPKMAEVMRSFLTPLMTMDGPEAAAAYLDQLPSLANGHNTGLKVGETRRTEESRPNPFSGGPLKAVSTLGLAKADPATGRASYVHTETLDPEAVKEFALKFGKQILAAAGDKAKGVTHADLDRLVSMIKLSMESSTRLDVENGMTRSIDETGLMSASAMGQTMTKQSGRTVTVAPAP